MTQNRSSPKMQNKIMSKEVKQRMDPYPARSHAPNANNVLLMSVLQQLRNNSPSPPQNLQIPIQQIKNSLQKSGQNSNPHSRQSPLQNSPQMSHPSSLQNSIRNTKQHSPQNPFQNLVQNSNLLQSQNSPIDLTQNVSKNQDNLLNSAFNKPVLPVSIADTPPTLVELPVSPIQIVDSSESSNSPAITDLPTLFSSQGYCLFFILL